MLLGFSISDIRVKVKLSKKLSHFNREGYFFNFPKRPPIRALYTDIQGGVHENMHIRKAKGRWLKANGVSRMTVIFYN
jgi:hypothetical protein